MNTRKVIYLLALLREQTEGREEELNRLYKNALAEDPDVRTLKEYLTDCSFFKGIGEGMRQNGEKLLNRLRLRPSAALETLRNVRQLNETIGHELDCCRALLCSPEPFADAVTVLRKSEIPACRQALKQIANVCVYLIAVYQGVEPLKELYWTDTAELQELIYAVNTRFIPALCRTPRPERCWIITRKQLGGQALLGGCGFFLTYENLSRIEPLCGGTHGERMGTHAYLNIRAFYGRELDVPYCWGMGNLVSASPEEGLGLLEGGIATKPRVPGPEEFRETQPSPLECLRRLTEGGPFCVSPEELVTAMNQWEAGHEAEKRRGNRQCLFCGKPLKDGQLVCPAHFTTEMT